MSSKIKQVMMKEFKRFFSDKRIVFTTIIMPGLMIYIMYSIMGQGLAKNFGTSEEYVAKVYVQGLPETFKELEQDDTLEFLDEKPLDEMKQDVQNKNADALVIFPDNFEQDVVAFDNQSATDAAPNVKIYYNSSETHSYNVYDKFATILDGYENMLANKFDVNAGEETYDLVTSQDSTGKTFSMLLPMLMMIFLFSGCLAVAPESIAGEKERGTMATMLVTPTKRSDLAIGKIISLSIIALLSGASSFLGTILSIPKLMEMDSSEISAAVYSTNDYIMLLFVILSTVLVLVSLISVISAFAKSVKEATAYVTPLMLVVCLIGVTSTIAGGGSTPSYMYFIPCYNTVQCMSGIFGFDYSAINVLITSLSNIVFAGVLVFILTKMFDSEKMMY